MIRATFPPCAYGLFTTSVSWKTKIFPQYEVISPDQHQNIHLLVQSSARFGKQSRLSKDNLTYKGTQAITCTYRIYSLIIRSRLRRSGQILNGKKLSRNRLSFTPHPANSTETSNRTCTVPLKLLAKVKICLFRHLSGPVLTGFVSLQLFLM